MVTCLEFLAGPGAGAPTVVLSAAAHELFIVRGRGILELDEEGIEVVDEGRLLALDEFRAMSGGETTKEGLHFMDKVLRGFWHSCNLREISCGRLKFPKVFMNTCVCQSHA
jgi:hypothetical protein